MKDNAHTRHNGIDHSVRRLIEDCTYTSKEYFTEAAILNSERISIGVTSSFAAGTIVLALSISLPERGFIVPICSFIALIASALMTALNPGSKSSLYARIGNEYLQLQKKAQDFLDIDLSNDELSATELRSKLNLIRNERELLYNKYSDAIIPNWVHIMVRKMVQSGESSYDFEARN